MAPNARKKTFLFALTGWTCAAALVFALGKASASAADDRGTRGYFDATRDAERIFIGRPKALTELRGPGQQKLFDEVFSCGVTSSGPGCLDSEFERSTSSVSVLEGKHAHTVFSVIRHVPTQHYFAVAIELPVETESKAPGRISVIALDRQLTSTEVRDQYAAVDEPAILTASIAADPKNIAQRALVKAEDARGIYHLSEFLVDHAQLNPQERQSVLAEIATRADLVARTGTPKYHRELLNLVRRQNTRSNDGKEALIALATPLLRSSDDGVAQLAAISLAENDSVVQGVRERLREIMASNEITPEVRESALKSLIRYRQSADDENAIIATLGDVSPKLRNLAASAAASFALTPSHLNSIRGLARGPVESAHVDAIELLARIGTAETKTLILSMIDSPNEATRDTAVRALKAAGIGTELVPQLKKIFASSQTPAVRSQVVNLLSDLQNSAEATSLLLQAATDEAWEVRGTAIRVLATVEGPKATAALVDRMTDTDRDTRGAATRAMATRKLAEADLPVLRGLLNSSSPDTRIAGIVYLSRIETAASLNYLNQMLSDPSPAVQAQAQRALNGIPQAKVADASKQDPSDVSRRRRMD